MVPGAKLPQRQNVPGAKCPKEKTSYSNYQVSKTNFVLENWSHMLGNGPHPYNQFMIAVIPILGRLS